MKINKIKLVTKCKKCGKITQIGEKTGECLDCLDDEKRITKKLLEVILVK